MPVIIKTAAEIALPFPERAALSLLEVLSRNPAKKGITLVEMAKNE